MSSQQQLLSELLKLAADKEIPYSASQLTKMSMDRLEEVYTEYKEKELDSVNEAIADMLIIKFEELMKAGSLVSQDSRLARKLQDRKMFTRDVKYFVSYVTPFLPFVGLLEGGLVIASEMFDNMGATDNNKNEDTPCQAKEGNECHQASTDVNQHEDGS